MFYKAPTSIKNQDDMNSGLEVTPGHWKLYHSKALEKFPIRIP